MSTPERNIGAQAFGWWRTLIPEKLEDGPINRGALARLRRAGDPVELAFIKEVAQLQRRLKAKEDEMIKVARIAHLLAHVRENAFPKVARALGPQAGDEDKAPMSEARFRRLLQVRDPEDIDLRLIRAVKMLKGAANVADLADAVWWWNDKTRRYWAFQYFNAPPPEDEAA
ncbi:MAG: CRISPR-associated protein [Rhodospirillaceae bacterium]|nr:MAG: CRISPR-associated protein [Rhodospirillaceae bacterium]